MCPNPTLEQGLGGAAIKLGFLSSRAENSFHQGKWELVVCRLGWKTCLKRGPQGFKPSVLENGGDAVWESDPHFIQLKGLKLAGKAFSQRCRNTGIPLQLCPVHHYWLNQQSSQEKNPASRDSARCRVCVCLLCSWQDSGRRPEELNPAEIMSYQQACNTEPFPEPQPAPAAYPPVTFLPQNPYQQHPTNEPTYSNTGFPAPGPRAPFSFPKEQSV